MKPRYNALRQHSNGLLMPWKPKTIPTRRRLRKLYALLYGPPTLVQPVPVIGGEHSSQRAELWGAEVFEQERRGLRLSPPADWARAYEERKDGHVTYDPETAQAHLLSLVKIPKLTIEPVNGEKGNNRWN